ncbi:MAG: carbon-nitrogen hydrolase family protein [Blastocatellia bacterium]|nr:carbon-nitrogen hydrolase family protein [Blastocatellia bacterium]
MSSPRELVVALVQMCSTDDVAGNCDYAERQLIQCAQKGARWVLFPENVCYLRKEGEQVDWTEALTREIVARFCQLAERWNVYILLGSIPEPDPASTRLYNSSVLISPRGEVTANYRKLHLFDAVLPDGQLLVESKFVEPGNELIWADVDGVKAGLTICYDLRFPELYRALTFGGAAIITVPSAFTVPTGQAHWEVLLRARAIENQVFILAPAQTGQHSERRSSFGHSLIVGPWGDVIAAAGQEETIVWATLDLEQIRKVRQRMPCLEHRRFQVSGPHVHVSSPQGV